MSILITICARGGSRGLPNKNIKTINGKPLIAYTIDIAKKFKGTLSEKYPVHIALSTDSKPIRDVAFDCGLPSNYIRSKKLATDNIGKIDVIKDLLFFTETSLSKRFEIILDLDVTSPLRTIEDLMSGLSTLQNDKNALNLFSVSQSSRNPYFNMVEKKEGGYYNVIKQAGRSILSRQKAPHVFDMNASFYFFRRMFFDKPYKSSITEASLIHLMDHICFDIDDQLDFEIMEYLLRNHKLDFELA